jgi:hypothetical protein
LPSSQNRQFFPADPAEEQRAVRTVHEAMLFFQQASRGTGKSSGRTADKAIVPAMSDKPLPLCFLKEADLKEQMVQGYPNPLKDTTFLSMSTFNWSMAHQRATKVTQLQKVIDGGD